MHAHIHSSKIMKNWYGYYVLKTSVIYVYIYSLFVFALLSQSYLGRMRDLINRKWSTFALRLFNWRLIRFIIVLIAFQTAVFIGPRSLYYHKEEDDEATKPYIEDYVSINNNENNNENENNFMMLDKLNVLRLICEFFVFIASSLKFYTELGELLQYGISAHFLRFVIKKKVLI